MFGRSHSEDSKNKQKEKAKGRFSLDWFIDRYGEIDGLQRYNDRKENLSRKALMRNKLG